MHGLRDVSKTYLKKLTTLVDYSGICIMIVGCYYPPLYYIFDCYKTLQIVYLTIISVLGVIGICFCSIPVMSLPRFKYLRTGINLQTLFHSKRILFSLWLVCSDSYSSFGYFPSHILISVKDFFEDLHLFGHLFGEK